MAKKEIPAAQLALLNSINRVDGFDPDVFAVEYTDLNTNEVRKRLPVMAQMAWFRLKYPSGKITVSVTSGNGCFVANAKVYPSYQDPADNFLAEATASRGPDPSKPSVSPREWAQTAAVGIALRNAGFGLQFGAAGDDFVSQAPNEFGTEENVFSGGFMPPDEGITLPAAGPEEQKPVVTIKEMTPQERFQQAASMMWPTKKHAGRTLGEVMQMEPAALSWLANKYMGNPEASEAARYMCEYALSKTSE